MQQTPQSTPTWPPKTGAPGIDPARYVQDDNAKGVDQSDSCGAGKAPEICEAADQQQNN